jgi:hypothetical protein
MNTNFKKDTLNISLSRNEDETITIEVSSDFANSNRKSQLFVNEDKIRNQVEQFWKSISTKKAESMRVYFDEIDHYDSDVDVYQTPTYSIDKSFRKALVEHRAHGSIPKDWAIVVEVRLSDTKTNAPIMDILEKMLYHKFPTDGKVEIIHKLKAFLNKEVNHISYDNDSE